MVITLKIFSVFFPKPRSFMASVFPASAIPIASR